MITIEFKITTEDGQVIRSAKQIEAIEDYTTFIDSLSGKLSMVEDQVLNTLRTKAKKKMMAL